LILGSCAQSNFQKQKFTNLKHLTSSDEVVTEEQSTDYHSIDSDELEYSEPISFGEFEEHYEESSDDFDEEIILDDDCGDRITFKSGAYLKVKIIQVNKHDVVYRKCDDLNGPAYTVIKDDLAELKYSHGGTEDLSVRDSPVGIENNDDEEKPKEEINQLSDKQKPFEPFAIVSFILAFTYILWIPAIIFGIISLVIQKNNPDQYRSKSKFFAAFGIIFPLALVLLGGAIVLLLLFL